MLDRTMEVDNSTGLSNNRVNHFIVLIEKKKFSTPIAIPQRVSIVYCRKVVLSVIIIFMTVSLRTVCMCIAINS